jgi:hypothetical protein
LPTLPERIERKIRAARDILDPPTPVRILISGALFAAVSYLTVHFVRTLYTDDIANPAIYPLYWIGIVAVTVLDLGWMSKKQRAKRERRLADAAHWRETIAAHNARVAAQLPPSTTPPPLPPGPG